MDAHVPQRARLGGLIRSNIIETGLGLTSSSKTQEYKLLRFFSHSGLTQQVYDDVTLILV